MSKFSDDGGGRNILVRMSAHQKDLLDEFARSRRWSVSQVIRDAVAAYMQAAPPPIPGLPLTPFPERIPQRIPAEAPKPGMKGIFG